MSNMREMKPVSKKRAFRLPLALLPVLVAVPVSAQQSDTGVVRASSVWQKDVDQLRMDIMTQRRIELEYRKQLSTLQMRMEAAAMDSNRSQLQTESQFVFNRLREAGAEQVRLRRKLESLCLEVRKPEGWFGVFATGMKMSEKRGDGTMVIRFLEPPVVASVDAGSPADRAGVRTGDVLIELGGKQLLREKVIFSELLRPGERLVVKLQRGNEVMTLAPVIEPLPEVTATPCTWVDAGVAFVVAPQPAQAPVQVRARTSAQGGVQGYAYVYPSEQARRDSGAMAVTTTVPAAGAVYAGPMVGMFTGGANVLAGLRLVTLSSESSAALGISQGILVDQVLPGPGREAGLKGGDILVSADSQDLRSIEALRRVLNRAQDRTVTIVIVRDKKRETVQLKW